MVLGKAEVLALSVILHGDCEQLPIPVGDLLLTDPPYGISRSTGFTNTKDKRYASYEMDYGEWDREATQPQQLAKQAARWLRRGGTAIIFYSWQGAGDLARSMTAEGFSKIRLIVWDKTNPVPVNARYAYLSNAREVAVCGVKGKVKGTFNSYYDRGNYEHPLRDGGANLHPTQKPLALMKELVRKHSNEGDLVIDPYCGSGTTCLAAKRLGRRYVGADVSVEYCGVAEERLRSCEPRLQI